jgi:hypothetical protein
MNKLEEIEWRVETEQVSNVNQGDIDFTPLEQSLQDFWVMSAAMHGLVDNVYSLIGTLGENCFVRNDWNGSSFVADEDKEVPWWKVIGRRLSGQNGEESSRYCQHLLGMMHRHNMKLVNVEKGFLNEDGLEGRPWFKHVGVAPGLWTGYGAQVFPQVQEALQLGEVGRAQEAINEAAYFITQVIEQMSPVDVDI